MHLSCPSTFGLEPAAAAAAALRLYMQSDRDPESLISAGWIHESGLLGQEPELVSAEQLYRKAQLASTASRHRQFRWDSIPSLWGGFAAQLAVCRLKILGKWGARLDLILLSQFMRFDCVSRTCCVTLILAILVSIWFVHSRERNAWWDARGWAWACVLLLVCVAVLFYQKQIERHP
jgi:hypothetical protein